MCDQLIINPINENIKKKILFIDDEIQELSTYIKVLKLEGFNIDKYDSLEHALEAFKSAPLTYSMVILDIMMPSEKYIVQETQYGRSTGLKVLEELKNIRPNIPIIILSVVRDPSIIEMTKNKINKYLFKPLLPSVLISEIKQVFESIKESKK